MAVLNEEQEMLRDMAREWTVNESPVTEFRKVRASGEPEAFNRDAYATMAQMGFDESASDAAPTEGPPPPSREEKKQAARQHAKQLRKSKPTRRGRKDAPKAARKPAPKGRR